MAYTRKTIGPSSNELVPFSVVSRPDICAHPHIQVLDVIHVGEEWWVINVYHDLRDTSGLEALLSLDLDPFIPTLVMGDFNTHSRSWSPSDVAPSYWAWRLEEWAVCNLLTLANTPSVVTRKGSGRERDSVLDLAWYNAAAIDRATFSDLRVDWEGSLGSDHAALHVTARTRHDLLPRRNHDTNPGYLVEDGAKQKWQDNFKLLSQQRGPSLLSQTPTREEVDLAAQNLDEDINKALEAACRKRRPFHPKAAPWWTEVCSQAVTQLRIATDRQTRKTASARLKGAVRAAKRTWADGVISQSGLWEVATWRHGRKTSKIPPLRSEDGLTKNHAEMAEIFARRFFVHTPPDVPLRLADDPRPRQTRSLQEIPDFLIQELLEKTSNTSAPGTSGHTWKILKWVWEAAPQRLTTLVRACVRVGHLVLLLARAGVFEKMQ
jgi:hypothetical protein